MSEESTDLIQCPSAAAHYPSFCMEMGKRIMKKHK